MKDVVILGCTSNICKIRVFNNLNRLHKDFSNILCCSSENLTSTNFRNYVEREGGLVENKINDKIHYVRCEYNYTDYKTKLSALVHDDTIIYVSTPPLCYSEILRFFNELSNKSILVLEKPLSINYTDYESLRGEFEGNSRIAMIDHFICKRDIIKAADMYKDTKVTDISIRFLYADDVENRLGYFDKTGFFIDMFQSHFLSIIHLLVGKRTETLLTSKVLSNERKQYISYGGSHKVDTYFYVEIKSEDLCIRVEAGKAMKETTKEIGINDTKYDISNYNDEYEIFFKGIIDGTMENMLPHQGLFWKISEMVAHDAGDKVSYYTKNKFSGLLEERSRKDIGDAVNPGTGH